MEVLDNKCPSCGAKIEFNPKNQKWDCEYCGEKYTLEEMQKYNNASSVEVKEKSTEKVEKIKKGEFDVYRCKNCGAEIIADETTTSTFCLYCGSTAILKDKIEEGRAPNYIIPFKNEKEDAIKAFKAMVKKKPLVPRMFKRAENIEKITGVYIPFWAYDLLAEGEIDFNAVDIRSWSDSNYRYTETKRYDVSTKGHIEYEKVLADASSRFDDDLMDSLEPFNYDELVEYNHAYLSGFLAEKYDIEEKEGIKRAEDRTMNTCIELMKERVGHQSSTVSSNKVNITSNKNYYLMLPVWMVNIKYNDKFYTFAMNGQTGKIIGNLPVGKKEVTVWTISLFVLIYAIGLLFIVLGGI